MKIGLIVPSFFPATIYGGPIFSTKLFCESIVKKELYSVEVLTTDCNKGKKLDVIKNKKHNFLGNMNIHITYYKNSILSSRISFKLILNLRKKIKTFDIVKIEDTFSIYVPLSLLICYFYSKKRR